MDSVWLAQLRAGDQESWQRFLVAYHHVFRRAVGVGLWRLGQPSMPEDRRRLAVVAMKCCREALKGSHGSTWDVTEQGEGRFRAYLFHTVVKSLHEQSFVSSGSGGTQHPPALQWQHDVEVPGAGALLELRQSVVQLAPGARSVILLNYIEANAPSLKEIAQVFQQDYDALRELHRNSLQSLSAAIATERDPSPSPSKVAESLARLCVDEDADTGGQILSRSRIWKFASGEMSEQDLLEMGPLIALRRDSLRELAVADCLLSDAVPMDPVSVRQKIAGEVLGGRLPLGVMRPFHWLLLAIVLLIGTLMFFDDGQPVSVRVVGLTVEEIRKDQSAAGPRSCEFRLDLRCRHDRNISLLLVSVMGGDAVIHQLFPPSLVPSDPKRLPANPRQAGTLYNFPDDTGASFRYPWVEGMGVIVVSSDPVDVLSPAVIEGLVATAKIVLAKGGLDPSTYRRLVKALTESAQHDLIEAHVQWIDL